MRLAGSYVRMMSEAGPLRIGAVTAAAYTIPTDGPESDGTLEWDSTTMVAVYVEGNGETGFGYTYSNPGAVEVVTRTIAPAVLECPMHSPRQAWERARAALRNLGFSGIGAMALSAFDTAMWDLWAKLAGIPLVSALGAVRESVPVYGSGGFTSYSEQQLRDQLAGWVEDGIPRVKMKVGRHPGSDAHRVREARRAIGPHADLFVDANGAYSVRQAQFLANCFREHAAVSWFEEPRPASDTIGTSFVRAHAPLGMEIAGGEYIFNQQEAARLMEASCLDVIQCDVTRCGGYTGALEVAALARVHGLPISAHCAPALSLPLFAAIPSARHIEYFHDHARIEAMFIDGSQQPHGGELRALPSPPGHGFTLKYQDLARWRVL